MSDLKLLKNKLLTVASTGAYVNFEPSLIHSYYEELDQFLLISSDSLNPIALFNLLEFQFYLSLITSHDVKAKTILDRFSDQFDTKKSQRIKLMHSMYKEAQGKKREAMDILSNQADEVRLSRRLTTFSRNDSDSEVYIRNLNYYLDLQPSDLVTWAELGDEYSKIGHYEKAIFCYKEILLQEPLVYHIFYKVGLSYYLQFLQEYRKGNHEKKETKLELMEMLLSARDNFLRAIEIFDSYSKAWVGIFVITNLEFNDKLKNLNTKIADKFLSDNEKLKKLSERKIRELENIEEERNLNEALKSLE